MCVTVFHSVTIIKTYYYKVVRKKRKKSLWWAGVFTYKHKKALTPWNKQIYPHKHCDFYHQVIAIHAEIANTVIRNPACQVLSRLHSDLPHSMSVEVSHSHPDEGFRDIQHLWPFCSLPARTKGRLLWGLAILWSVSLNSAAWPWSFQESLKRTAIWLEEAQSVVKCIDHKYAWLLATMFVWWPSNGSPNTPRSWISCITL